MVPLVPTGMNTGVRIVPCAVSSVPARADPAVASMREVADHRISVASPSEKNR